MLTNQTIKNFADYCDKKLSIEGKTDPNLSFYKSLPICILDAVYSIGVKYSSTARVTERYIEYYNLDISRSVAGAKEHTIEDFLKNISDAGGAKEFAEKVVHNRQRTSSRNGILKAEACELVAEVCKKHGIDTLADFNNYDNKDALDKDIRSIKGQHSGISLKYLKMLCGNNNLIKPDRMVKRFVAGFSSTITSDEDLQELVSRAATDVLKLRYPNMTPRLLDYLIWEYQKNIKI